MRRVKLFAMYLPQYHVIPENSQFWGKGFTDWVAVRNAVPLFEGHEQPKKPIDEYYYDLSKKEDIMKQVELAVRYKIDGWGIYHYWFSSEKCVLTKPAEILYENKDIEIPFFFAWDNGSWIRTWSNLKGNAWAPCKDAQMRDIDSSQPEVLLEYKLGGEKEWKIHFDYLLPYFQDERYFKHHGKPLFIIFSYSKDISRMTEYWNNLAIENGFCGMEFVYNYRLFHGIPLKYQKFSYEPSFSGWESIIDQIVRLTNKRRSQRQPKIYSYDDIWKKILWNAKICNDDKRYFGAFVNYDDTPRRGNQGKVVLGGTPGKFQRYLSQLISISEKKNKDIIFLTAWNEWGEGAYLEPDMKNGTTYLEAIRKVVLDK